MQAKHVFVTGSSGGGKTTYLRELHATTDACSLYLTAKRRESNVSGDSVSTAKGLRTAVSRASRAADVRCKLFGASYPEDTRLAREWAHAVREHRGWPVQIIVDEAHNSPLSQSEGPLKDGLHEDRDMGIKWVPCTQSVQDMKEKSGYPAIDQCQYIVWVGQAKTTQKGFVEHYNLREKVPRNSYHYHVIDPSLPPRIVYKGQTNPTYG